MKEVWRRMKETEEGGRGPAKFWRSGREAEEAENWMRLDWMNWKTLEEAVEIWMRLEKDG